MQGYKEATCKVLCSRLDAAGYFRTLRISPVTWISPVRCAQGRAGVTAARGGSWGSRPTRRLGSPAAARSIAGRAGSGTGLK